MTAGGSPLYVRAWCVLCFLSLWGCSWGQLRYSVPEESQPGTFVGNVARDLGLDPAAVSERRLRLGSDSSTRYFTVNLDNGDLNVNKKIDREAVCGSSASCLLTEEVVIVNPLELFSLEVEILDINDNSPSFHAVDTVVRMTELIAIGSRIPLEGAIDPDVGVNSVRRYRLDTSQYFSLSVNRLKDGTLFPELVLDKPLDRESQETHHLSITASDGGNPARSGTAQVTLIVLDVNDNAPLFNQSVYKVKVRENAPLRTVLMELKASDADDGINGEIEYLYGDRASSLVRKLFHLEPSTGRIRIEGVLDFEESTLFEIHVRARDKGVPEMEGRCIVQVEIEDSNDNAPEILVTSLASSVPENAHIGTVVGLLQVRDKDSGQNGEVNIELSSKFPFQIKPFKKHYSLITDGYLDREKVSQYAIELLVTDLGSPPLHARKTIVLNISDINDNPPQFPHPVLYAYVKENNDPAMLLCTVSASDPDQGENSRITYSILESQIDGSPISSYMYISSSNGNIYAQRSFDYECLQVMAVTVLAEDGGSPMLSSNITVFIYIVDQNDNPPVILYPVTDGDLCVDHRITQTFSAGYLVTKVTAVDADSGHNAWLSYSIVQYTDPSLFRISTYSGEIRAARGVQERDNLTQQLIVQVTDNGIPPLSSCLTILLSLEDSISDERFVSGDFHDLTKEESDRILYLIISLVSISVLSLVTFIILSVKCMVKSRFNLPWCCCSDRPKSIDFSKHFYPTLQLDADGRLRYREVGVRASDSPNTSFRTCLAPDSNRDFTIRKPLDFPELKDMVSEKGTCEGLLSGLEETNQVRSSSSSHYSLPCSCVHCAI